MNYPTVRLRRLRRSPALRGMVRETTLDRRSLVYPMFVCAGSQVQEPVESMPGVFRLSIDMLVKEMKEIAGLGVPAVLLFGIPERRDERATAAYAKNGVVQTAVKAIKDKFPQMVVATDVCLCAYTTSGHCGIVKRAAAGADEAAAEDADAAESGEPSIQNDLSLEMLAKMAVSHAEAGADMVAPSSMMDGQVAALRKALDANNLKDTAILSYSAKFASALYGPFRDAAQSSPEFGDRATYQMDPANAQEALREIEQDINEGADIVMVKPALAYLDIIRRAKEQFNVPLAAYQVSGEYAMIKAAAAAGWLEEKPVVLETLLSIHRAGADVIITYYAKEVARWLSGQYLL